MDVSQKGANDATLVLRITTLITNAWFDVIAPYHPTAVGVYSRLGRQPTSEATTANKNTAILYGSYRVLTSILPQHSENWRDMLTSAGLNPDDDQESTANATGIGNLAGNAGEVCISLPARANPGGNSSDCCLAI